MEKSTKQKVVQMAAVWRASIDEYTQEWFDEYINAAYQSLARDNENNPLPFAAHLTLSSGRIVPDDDKKNYQRVEKKSHWTLSVCVFNSVQDVKDYVEIMRDSQDFEGKIYYNDRSIVVNDLS